MNKIFLLLSTIALFLFSSSCKTAQKSKESNTKVMGSDTASSYPDQMAEVRSRFKVAFISPGSGIDRKMKEKYDEYITKFEKENGVTLEKEILHLGKEGETTYCFNLSELNKKKQEKFISESTELLKSSSKIHVEENAICH